MGCGTSAGQTDVVDITNIVSDQKGQPQKRRKSSHLIVNRKGSKKNAFQKDNQKINFQPLLKELKQNYKKYRKDFLASNNSGYYDDIQQQIRAIIIGVIKQKMSQVNQNQLTMKQCKVQIASKILEVMIQVLKYVVKAKPEDADIFFRQIGIFLKQLCGFLKTKYPRIERIEAGQLARHFKQFDTTQNFENDILRNAGFCFSSQDQSQIAKTIKLFLNKVMDQLDVQYPKFKAIIEKISDNAKIGRKISQNTAKYSKIDTGTLEGKSIQISRVLIKWYDGLSQIVAKDKQRMNVKCQYKLYQKNQNDEQKILIQRCSETKFSQFVKNGLINDLQSQTPKFQKSLKLTKDDYVHFNFNLMSLLNQVEHYQNQVSREEMQVIKYSNCNSDFIAWMVQERLIEVIKALVQIGSKYKESLGALDLVKFKINDLMRCQFLGNRKKILDIYHKLLELDQNKEIQIIKIKNRFQTSMNDAMIMFKLPESFLVCQCQLVLSQESKGQDNKKAKNIQILNHFLYQLERSPFGVLGQATVFLKAKSPSVAQYYDKLDLILQQKPHIQKCIRLHKQSTQIQGQQKPFVCSKCVNYFGKYSNILKIHNCQMCRLTICNRCMGAKFEITQQILTKQLQKKIEAIFSEAIQQVPTNALELKYSFSKSCQQLQSDRLNQIITQLSSERAFNQIFKESANLKIKFKSLRNEIKMQSIMSYLEQNYREAIKNGFKVNFVIATWRNNTVKFKCYRYDPGDKSVVNSYQPLQRYWKHEYIEVNDYDLFLEFNKIWNCNFNHTGAKGQDFCPYIFQHGLCIFDGQQKAQIMEKYDSLDQQGQDQYFLNVVQASKQFYIIIDVDHSVKSSKRQGWIKEYLDQLPNLTQFKKHIELQNSEITDSQLVCFQTLKWKNSIKTINLSGNHLKNIACILLNCHQLQELNVSNNEIQELSFQISLDCCKHLNAQFNEIKLVKNLINIKNAIQINLGNNKISHISISESKELKCSQKQNNVVNSKSKKANTYPNQDNLFYNYNMNRKRSNQKQGNQNSSYGDFYQFVYLKLLYIHSNYIENVDELTKNVYYPSLIELHLNKNQLTQLQSINAIKMKVLKLECNQIQKIDKFAQGIYPNLIELKLNMNQITDLPMLYAQKLQKLFLKSNKLQSIQRFSQNAYPKLNLLDLSFNKLKFLPPLQTLNLEVLNIQTNQLQSIKKFISSSSVTYPNLQQINLKSNLISSIPKIPELKQRQQQKKLPKLKNLLLDKNPILQISNMTKKIFLKHQEPPHVFQQAGQTYQISELKNIYTHLQLLTLSIKCSNQQQRNLWIQQLKQLFKQVKIETAMDEMKNVQNISLQIINDIATIKNYQQCEKSKSFQRRQDVQSTKVRILQSSDLTNRIMSPKSPNLVKISSKLQKISNTNVNEQQHYKITSSKKFIETL